MSVACEAKGEATSELLVFAACEFTIPQWAALRRSLAAAAA